MRHRGALLLSYFIPAPLLLAPPLRRHGPAIPQSAPMPIDLDAQLRRFGHGGFRPGQREAVEVLLDERRLLLVAPTGGGKSLSYQLPAMFLPGTTLVVSPLIALMQDQVASLHARGVAATYLASTLDAQESRSRMRALAAGRFDLVYVAPERLVQAGFRSLLADMACPLVAVDEAHCISEWGHDFRPEYRDIREAIEALRDAAVLACTATATPVVRDEIIHQLGLPADTPQLVHGFARPNLSLRAREYQGRRERSEEVDAVLAEALGRPDASKGTAIVYAPTRRGAEEEAERLASVGWRVDCYHAGMDARRRTRVHDAFATDRLEVVVATNAFGMGIDRPDVRAVVHLGPPGSLEAYYQEVGRAGRDGQSAVGLLLHTPADLPLRRHLLESGSNGSAPERRVVEHKWNLFLELMRWADAGSCRHDAVLRYFGDEAETLSGCGVCDVCRHLVADDDERDLEQVTLVVRKVLSGVARVDRRFGMGVLVSLLRGVPDKRLARQGLDRVSTYGVLHESSELWLQKVVRRLVTAGWVSFTGGERPVMVLTESGRRVMRGELPARVVLPSPDRSGRRTPSTAVGGTPSEGSLRRGRAGGDSNLDAAGLALFEALRAWRLETARAANVPPYVIASDRTLADVAQLRPRNRDELMLCHGIGPARADRYGAAILALLARLRQGSR